MSVYTEDEAKTKWCPFARVARDIGSSFNRWTDGQAAGSASPAACIGSACMAWRELHAKVSREDHSGAAAFMATEGSRTNRIVRREGPHGCLGHLVLDAVGFCGLAGKP